jgi:hypothetical protein
MAADKQNSSRDRLPFEPGANKKKDPSKNKPEPIRKSKAEKSSGAKSGGTTIPEAVSQRMIRRMVSFSGIPTFLGLSAFVVFYIVRTRGWLEIPTVAVLITTLLCFGLGVLGLSYSVFSASWEEDRPGSFWGVEEFKVNLGRTIEAWRSRKKPKPSDS